MAALFHAEDRRYGQDLGQWLFSMFTMGIFSYHHTPLKVRARAFVSSKKEVYYGITSSNCR